ncbi:carbon-nitrogen hydrolase family protein [Treponema sp.]|uniref:carbon-nitrogen hydrolase family protein n=1 Tax=Treponema sp. TaxID=166 RepID=UPI00298DA480|nr:carbon-nitrogen hydrolase family protein [Treponema sp.]
MVKIATCCIHCVYNKEENLKKYFSFIDEAAAKGANLVVFPEQSLQGYLQSLVAMPYSDHEYQYTNAELVPEGETVQKIIAKAKEKNVYIVFGMTERDPEIDYKLYNSAVLVGPEGFVGKYRKVHLPGDELHIYSPGHSFPVFETKIGKIGMLICYDKQFPESARELALGGAEILVMPTAWPFNDPCPEHLADVTKDVMYKIYDTYDTSRAMENQLLFVSSNQVGKTGDIDYIGCSTITDPYGTKLCTTGCKEGIAMTEVDLKKAIFDYKKGTMLGLNLLFDRNTSAYKLIKEENFFK